MKKAIAVTELMLILLTVGLGIALAYLGKTGAEKTGCLRDVEICRDSYALFKGFVKKIAAPRLDCFVISPPNCEQTTLDIPEKDLEKKKQKILHIIAENLRWCWHKTLGNENKIGEDFATAWYRPVLGGETKDVDFCLVCSEFTMPNDVSISASEWNAQLKKTIPGQQKTYEEYINLDPEREKKWREKQQKAFQPGSAIWRKADLNYRNIGFDSGKTYYVISVSAESTADNALGLYIGDEIYCGESNWQQIHNQRTR